MEYENVLYDEEEYRAFGKALIGDDAELEDMLEDQDVINGYNKLKETGVEFDLAEITKMVPQIKGEIIARQGGQGNEPMGKRRMDALDSIEGE